MKKILLIVLCICSLTSIAQKSNPVTNAPASANLPGLIVGIVVDQMRYDYLYRFWNKYSSDGFKRLVNDGYVFGNANYNYVPTYTAPGHACIYTGTTPAYNGIISNEWFDRYQRKSIYCVNDTTVMPVGTTSISGKMSPRNLLSTTITDELRLATNMTAKVIGIALKDRGAILPAGHDPTGAYWHDPYSNNWVTSTFYMKQLPEWVSNFNKRKMIDSLLSKKWTTLLPIEQYTESTADDNEYEGLYDGESKPVFPHDLPALRDSNSELIRETPFGNTLTKEFAIAAIQGENLGKGKATDFLAVSFSSTDYVGHMFGTNAIELEDTYIRLDRDIAALLKFLDEWTGNNYTLFITADHGAVNNPIFSKDRQINSGKFESRPVNDSLKKYLRQVYNSDSLLLNAGANNIILNRPFIEANKIDLEDVQNKCVAFVSKFNGVSTAMTATELSKGLIRTGLYSFMQNGYNFQRSADVMILLQPGWVDWFTKTGTTHGAAYSYDTHVPLIFFGKRIKQGFSASQVTVCDIAPTISTMLNIEFPSGKTGHPLEQVIK
jgi:predicted AlkP superfamily pyrophosphatase or phosphodiesterase